MKKLFLILALCLCSLVSWAEVGDTISAVSPTGQTLYYKITSRYTVAAMCPGSRDWSGYDAPTGDLTIPNTVRYNNVDYSVISIGSNAFRSCASLTSVTIPNSITTIGGNAFRSCASLTSVTIPNSVTTIEDGAFHGCSGLTSVTIPNSVTSIGGDAFNGCSGLTYVVIGSSVNSIGSNAFLGCLSLKTVYWPFSQFITVSKFEERFMGGIGYVCRLIFQIVSYGSGENTIYKIPNNRTIVNAEDGNSSHIPYSQLPTNFIGKWNGSDNYVAREVVLTDGQDAFEAPETFTAGKVTYTREFTNSNRSTLCLPFTAAIPEDFEVYDFTNFANNTISFTKREDSIYAYTPYLVGYNLSKDGNTTLCTFTQENVVFPKTSTATPACTTTYNGTTFKGTMERKCMNSTNYGYKDGFFVQSANDSGHDAHAHVNPFRAYFEITSGDAPQSLPHTLNVEVGYGDPVGIDAAETPEQEYDNRYGKDVYDMLGRLVRKNADNLEGLPKGVYIWKGKKIMNYDL